MEIESSDWSIQQFNLEHEEMWDKFVMEYSMNGTFLQTRNFLNYHQKGKFEDISLEIYKKKKLVAVCPACRVALDGRNVFYSHMGSTFGGIVFSETVNNAKDMEALIDIFEKYIFRTGIDKVILRQTPDIFSKKKSGLLEYMLWKEGYAFNLELNTYVELGCSEEEIWSRIDKNKKRNIKKCEKENLWFRELESKEEIEKFYQLLIINLSKNAAKPIHSLEEILNFHNSRLRNETKFYGVGKGDELLAADMMFIFKQVKTMHSQNPSYDPFVERNFSPVTYLYYRLIKEAKKEGFDRLTWGISTEQCGHYLNMGLIRNKESYGSEHFVNITYHKELIR